MLRSGLALGGHGLGGGAGVEGVGDLLGALLEIILVAGADHGVVAGLGNCRGRAVVAGGPGVLVANGVLLAAERAVLAAHEVVHFIATHVRPPSERVHLLVHALARRRAHPPTTTSRVQLQIPVRTDDQEVVLRASQHVLVPHGRWVALRRREANRRAQRHRRALRQANLNGRLQLLQIRVVRHIGLVEATQSPPLPYRLFALISWFTRCCHARWSVK